MWRHLPRHGRRACSPPAPWTELRRYPDSSPAHRDKVVIDGVDARGLCPVLQLQLPQLAGQPGLAAARQAPHDDRNLLGTPVPPGSTEQVSCVQNDGPVVGDGRQGAPGRGHLVLVVVGLLRLGRGLLRLWRVLGHGHLAWVGGLHLVLLGGGRLLVCGHLGLLLLLLPGGGLRRRRLVGARRLLQGPVARRLLVGLRVLLVAWVLRVHRSRGREVLPLSLQLGAGQAVGLAQRHYYKGNRASKGSWPCAAAAWQFGVLHSTPNQTAKSNILLYIA